VRFNPNNGANIVISPCVES